MDAQELDRLTRNVALMNESSAFVVSQLARHHLGGLASDPDTLRAYLTQRQHVIPRSLHGFVTKAAVTAVDLSSGLAPATQPASAFLAEVDRVAPLAQIAPITVTGKIAGAIQTGSATASWVGEQTTKPVRALAFSAAPLRPLKLVSQIVVSQELADLSVPGALPIVQRSLIIAAAAAEATALLDPASTAIADVRPASLTAGLTPITPSGDFANNVGQVLNALSGGAPSRPALIVSLQTACRMQAALRDLASIGVRVIVSSAAGSHIIGVDADGVLVTTGGLEIQRSSAPAVQMNDAPDSPPTSSTVLTPLGQRSLVALKVERLVNWTARSGAVAMLTLA